MDPLVSFLFGAGVGIAIGIGLPFYALRARFVRIGREQGQVLADERLDGEKRLAFEAGQKEEAKKLAEQRRLDAETAEQARIAFGAEEYERGLFQKANPALNLGTEQKKTSVKRKRV